MAVHLPLWNGPGQQNDVAAVLPNITQYIHTVILYTHTHTHTHTHYLALARAKVTCYYDILAYCR